MNRDKELYQQLRKLPWEKLWRGEVPRFDAAPARERFEQVAVIRAVGVVFNESGNRADLESVKKWLRGLLNDSEEKIRRYAISTIPKLAADKDDEHALLELLEKSTAPREREHLTEALGKIGGAATLARSANLPATAEQRLKAKTESDSSLNVEAVLAELGGFKIILWSRAGLEQIVRDEVANCAAGKFRIDAVQREAIALTPLKKFSIADILKLRCFGFFGFRIATKADDIAKAITSATTRRLLETFTSGPIRYRLEYISKGHQRAAVRDLASRVYALAPQLINTGAGALWTIAIADGWIELRPRMNPDPRFTYRRCDVPAASHPPLAACMARLAGSLRDATIWDPFCGSGLELIERSLLGGVKKIIGTDRSDQAAQITRDNIAAAGLSRIETQIVCADFREFDPGPVHLIITNPPLGRRVPIPNLAGLFESLFAVAAKNLRPGGSLIFANPLRVKPRDASLKIAFSQTVDFGGFNCRLEKYIKA